MPEKTPRSQRAPSLPPDRAPRLRRIAELIDLQAEQCQFPDRARKVARDMRARAAEIECGDEAAANMAELMQELTG